MTDGRGDEQLRAAQTLIDKGRALEAIDVLTARYRDEPSARAAQLLVVARHRAFEELPTAPGWPAWPRAWADPFPGTTGVVAVSGAELSGALLGGAITHHGCLRVDRLLDDATVGRLRTHVEAAFVARDQVRNGAALESVAPAYLPYGPGREKAEGFAGERFIRLVDAPAAACDLVDVFADSGVLGAVTDYLGERPAMIANKWILRRSPTGVALGDFHQDGAFLGDGIRTVDCWIALSQCGPGTGRPAIDLVPRRVDAVMPTGGNATLDWAIAEEAVHDAFPDTPIASPVFEAGDAIFFDELLPHRTSPGTDLTTRYAIESWFVAPSSYPAKHLPIVL